MGLAVVTVASGGLPVVESTAGGTPVTEAANGYGVPVTKVIGKPGLPVVFDTLPPATLDGTTTNVTLSNGGLTATHANTTDNSGVRSTASKTVGKYYFEVQMTTSTGTADGVGIIATAGTFTNFVTNGTNCATVYRASGNIYSNNVNTGKTLGTTGVTGAVGIYFSVAIDLTGRLAWFRKIVTGTPGNWNNDPTANPATGVGGVAIAPTVAFAPAIGFGGPATAAGDSYTANYGASAFIGAVPAGFTSGWPA